MVYKDFRFFGAPNYTYVYEDHKTVSMGGELLDTNSNRNANKLESLETCTKRDIPGTFSSQINVSYRFQLVVPFDDTQ